MAPIGKSDVRARAVFGHRMLALAARGAVVVLAFFLTVPLVSEPISLPFTATMAGALLIAACGALALMARRNRLLAADVARLEGRIEELGDHNWELVGRDVAALVTRARPGGSGQPGEGPLPRDGVARDPHAAERHPRHVGAAARYAAAAAAGGLREGGQDLRRHAAVADRGNPRLLQDRGGTARSRRAAVRARRAGRGNRRVACPARAGERPRDRVLDRRRGCRRVWSAMRRGCARFCSISPATR